MTVRELAEKLNLEIASGEDSLNREIKSVYCCDLLSIVMGRAPKDSAWITIMGNINAVGVASLCDVSCIVLAEGMTGDENCLRKAKEQDIALLRSGEPIFHIAKKIDSII